MVTNANGGIDRGNRDMNHFAVLERPNNRRFFKYAPREGRPPIKRRLPGLQLGEQAIDGGVDFFGRDVLVANYSLAIQDVDRGALLDLPGGVNRAIDISFVPPATPGDLLFEQRPLEGLAIFIAVDTQENKGLVG